MNNLHLAPKRLHQTGVTLIELMVSIAIALFLVAGLTVLFMNMRTTFTSQDQTSQVQDSERVAVTMLTTTVQSAGYFVDPVNIARVSALHSTTANPDGTTFPDGLGIIGTSGVGTSDTVNVRYQTAPGDGVMNCLGASNPATSGSPALWINSFSVNAANELTCAVNGGAATTLVSNVSSMTVLYGVDTNGDGNVDTYLNAAAVSAASLWGNVQTAQFSLSFVNLMNSRPGAIVTMPQPWVQTISLMNNL
jgi:type IV pilus assembly protein PilW